MIMDGWKNHSLCWACYTKASDEAMIVYERAVEQIEAVLREDPLAKIKITELWKQIGKPISFNGCVGHAVHDMARHGLLEPGALSSNGKPLHWRRVPAVAPYVTPLATPTSLIVTSNPHSPRATVKMLRDHLTKVRQRSQSDYRLA